jgi:hypothetical protein
MGMLDMANGRRTQVVGEGNGSSEVKTTHNGLRASKEKQNGSPGQSRAAKTAAWFENGSREVKTGEHRPTRAACGP